VPYLSDKVGFLEMLIGSMYRRTFQLGGAQVVLERWIIRRIESFISPTLHAMFDEVEQAFAEREAYMVEWRAVDPHFPLSVSFLPTSDRRRNCEMPQFRLPSVFTTARRDLMSFSPGPLRNLGQYKTGFRPRMQLSLTSKRRTGVLTSRENS
jgi:hypothetical protein